MVLLSFSRSIQEIFKSQIVCIGTKFMWMRSFIWCQQLLWSCTRSSQRKLLPSDSFWTLKAVANLGWEHIQTNNRLKGRTMHFISEGLSAALCVWHCPSVSWFWTPLWDVLSQEKKALLQSLVKWGLSWSLKEDVLLGVGNNYQTCPWEDKWLL